MKQTARADKGEHWVNPSAQARLRPSSRDLGVRARCRLGRAAFLAALLSLWTLPAPAVPLQEYPQLDAIVEALVAQHGFGRDELQRLFRAASLRPEIVAAIERPHEALPWHAYRRSFLTEERVRLGARFWAQHKGALARAHQRFGVPAELIVAIIGVETRYGAYTGRHAVLDALLTLTLDYPRRSAFFRRELEEFLLLSRELELDPLQVKGSYAGALGIPQFIPSSYRQYAVDFDNDNRRDLLASIDDAVGSVANFLRRHGWSAGQPVIEPARVQGSPESWPRQSGVEPVLTLREWLAHGILPARADGAESVPVADRERAATLITLEGEDGPLYHLGYNNFYVITRYNRSQNYAMAVYELAGLIRQRYQEEQ